MVSENFTYKVIQLDKIDDDLREKYLDYQEAHDRGRIRDIELRSRDFRREESKRSEPDNYRSQFSIALADDKIVGSGYVGYQIKEQDTNPDTCWMNISVLSEYRNLEIGTQLLRMATVYAQEHNKSKIDCGVYKIDDPNVEDWLFRLNFKHGFVERISRLYKENINWDFVEEQEVKVKEKIANYEFIQYNLKQYNEQLLQDDEFAEKMADFFTETDNLIPREDAQWNDTIVTVADMRVRAKKSLENVDIEERIMYFAFDGDNPIAMSGTYHSIDEPIRDVGTGFTAVRKAYQRKGLATYLKILITKYFVENYPEFWYLHTGNAGSNEGMLHINHSLGFKYQYDWDFYQGTTDAVAKHLQID